VRPWPRPLPRALSLGATRRTPAGPSARSCSARTRAPRHAVRALTAAAAAAALVAAGLPAHAAPSRAASQRTLLLQLVTAPPQPVADRGRFALPRAERAARLQALLPGASGRSATEAAARRLGLTVTGGDSGSVRVSGPAAKVDRLFPPADARLGAVRRTPAVLRGLVSLAVDAGDRTPVAHPHATLSGSDLTTAYAAPQPPGGYPRTRPVLTPQTPVIASLQLSGWDSDLLTTYAQRQIFTADPTYDPVASGQYVGIGVDRDERWRPGTDDDEGDGEVALDQQALLAAAPSARQRAYFGSNSAQGYIAVLNRVLADVAAGVPIVAFSTSWGACEQVYGNSYLSEVERLLERLTAAGVTLFAASGDDGVHDCAAAGSQEPAVDYPASSPQVLGIGGTTHPNGAGAPLPDTAWSAPGRARGTGGGASLVYPRPSWQGQAGTGDMRQVPDLALPADIETGFAIYTADHSGGTRRTRGPDPVGGTSLAAPLAAGMLTDALMARTAPGDVVRGVGDIHRQLYTAAVATPGAFRDVVTAVSNTPPTIAPPGPGYDRATGLGTPDWTRLLGPLAAGPPPGPGRPGVLAPGLSTARVRLALAPPKGADIVAYYLADRDTGCSGAPLPAGNNPTVAVTEGERRVYLRALTRDLVCSPVTTTTLTVGTDDRKAARRGAWSARKTGAAFGKTYQQSAAAGSTLTWTATGRTFRVLLDTAPDGGVAQILLDGRPVLANVDTASSRAAWAKVFTVGARAGRHTIAVRVLGRQGRGSRSALVRVDGLVIVL